MMLQLSVVDMIETGERDGRATNVPQNRGEW